MKHESVTQGEVPRILIAAADGVMCVIAQETFTEAGFQVETVENGSEALSTFSVLNPDIVLLDVQMPDLDGFQTCIELRKLKGGAQTPILMMTGQDDLESIERAYQVGATDFVTKPVNWVILRQRVRYMVRAARAIQDQIQLQVQLQRSQKMEALGLLAGGVAHDFNNALTVITIHAQLLQHRFGHEEELVKSAELIRCSAEHAARLTGQLLAFGKKQLLEPTVVDLNQIVENVLKMLDRIMGEDVEILTELEPALWPVRLDPGRIEQVIMNLAVNAREAMPQGGRFTIRTRNCPSQEGMEGAPRVMLAVSDTGEGMDEGTLERVFEPFYTTKDSGTGLGLSTVHGIVKQSGGEISVTSTPGQGTRFGIRLTPFEGGEEVGLDEDGIDKWSMEGSETILLVEDAEDIRGSICTALEENGHTVLAASNGREGISLSRRYKGPIDFLITDVVMPEIGGVELAKEILRKRPETKILYMTGYSGDITFKHGLDSRAAFLQKPFDLEVLSRKMNSLLVAPSKDQASQ